MIGLLYLIFRKECEKVYSIDICKPPSFEKLSECWKEFYHPKESPIFIQKKLQEALPSLLESFLKDEICLEKVVILACHACTHLSEEIVFIASKYSIDFACKIIFLFNPFQKKKVN